MIPFSQAAMPRFAKALDHAPNALAVIRPVIGVASGFAVSTDNGAIAAWLYLAGYLSDVADGFLSRAINAKSDFGAALDGLADVAFHIAVGVGLMCAAIRYGTFGVLVILGILVGAERFMRRWIAARSVAGKGIGGAYRVVIFALLLIFCDPGQRPLLIEAGLTVMVITYVYEGYVTLNELRSGESPLR
jgi:phosphatidylglycerophosphate synthase